MFKVVIMYKLLCLIIFFISLISTGNTNCGGEFNVTQGNNTIESPSYPHTSANSEYWTCNYTIRVDEGYAVTLKVNDLDLERNVGFLKVNINAIENY